MPHPCALIEEGMRGFEACELGAAAHAADKVLGEAPAGTIATLKETLVANAPVITESINAAAAKMVEWLERAESLAGEQVPFLIKEVLRFEILDWGYIVALGLLGLIWGLYAWRWTYLHAEHRKREIADHDRALKKEWDRKNPNHCGHNPNDVAFSFLHFGIPISGAVAAVAGFFMVLCNIMALLKPIVAPRAFLIEYFRQLAG